MQYKDVVHTDHQSYENSERAKRTATLSSQKMDTIEEPMGRAVENFLMARLITGGDAPDIPKYKVTRNRPDGGENRPAWYKQMRISVTRDFWVKTTRQERDLVRNEAKTPPPDLVSTIDDITANDTSLSRDFFYQHHKDSAAASDPMIYNRIAKDVFMVLDRDGATILASVSQLFQRLFGDSKMRKVLKAVKHWASFPPLPQPNTARHMVDELIRMKHPELDMEKARTVKELEERAQCVVHYGTWANRGHMDPKNVHLTADTLLYRGNTMRDRANYPMEVMPQFKRGVLGFCSEVARFLFRHVAPVEYQACLETFAALPEEKRMSVSQPDWATLFVLGINSFTERHKDRTDVKEGFACLLPLGDYEGMYILSHILVSMVNTNQNAPGGDLCFPAFGLKLDYKPGGCVMFRGRELEHFVEDWSGYRVFLICTNHQPVRNWAKRRMGQTPALPTDPWFGRKDNRGIDGENGDSGDSDGVQSPAGEETTPDGFSNDTGDGEDDASYDPCIEEHLDPEPGPFTEAEIHGAGTWSPSKNFGDQSSSSETTTTPDGLSNVAFSS